MGKLKKNGYRSSTPIDLRRQIATCPDCGAREGELHEFGCDYERCTKCSGQFIFCDCRCAKCGGQFLLCDCPGKFKRKRVPFFRLSLHSPVTD